MVPAQNNMVPRRWQALLLLAALDTAVVGAWAAFRPGDLFTLLQYAVKDDGLLLCRLLGLLYLIQAVFLLLVAWRTALAGLTLGPLLGRLLTCGVWLWLMGSGRMATAGGALPGLLVHDGVWPIFFAAYLWTCRVKRLAAPPLTKEASPEPALPATAPAPPA